MSRRPELHKRARHLCAALRSGRSCAPLAVALTVFAACGEQEAPDGPAPAAEAPADPGLLHVHGLGMQGDDLLIATHTGLWAAAEGTTTPTRVGTSRQDVMGFTALADGRLLGSGHPGPEQDLPPNIGLIETRDPRAGWTSVSLLGEVDFHVLEAAGKRVYGFDGSSGRVLASTDEGRTWAERKPPGGVISMAIDPADPGRVAISTDRGGFLSRDGGRRWRPTATEPLGLLEWPEPDRLLLVDAEGALHVSSDAGGTWRRTGEPQGQPAAFHATPDEAFLALGHGTILRSTTDGRAWDLRVAP